VEEIRAGFRLSGSIQRDCFEPSRRINAVSLSRSHLDVSKHNSRASLRRPRISFLSRARSSQLKGLLLSITDANFYLPPTSFA
jgi:hypothetical protein